jgi:Arc/MetJ-type ribon-helix-helix transcriptional regulator
MENTQDKSYAATFSLKMSQIAMISDLVARTGKNRSELAQEAVELLFAKYEEKEPQPEATQP